MDGVRQEAAVNGGTEGSTSAAADLYIEVKLKSDSNGDGAANNADLTGFFAARATPFGTETQEQVYTHDYNSTGGTDPADLGGFFGARAADPSCP